MNKKIKILVIPSDRYGCGFFRSLQPHQYIQEHFSDKFDIDIMYELPNNIPYEQFFMQYDIVHIHKNLDNKCELINMMKFVGCKVVVDIDDHWSLGNDHPMSLTAKKEQWHLPVINHLKLADVVTTTTPIFAKEIKKHNKNVYVFPNAIDPNDERFQLNTSKSDKIRFGVICGSSHLKDLELMQGMTAQLSKETLDKMQFVLCGFDTNGTRTIYHKDTGKVERRPILPEETVWYEYEKILTNDYKIVSEDHKRFLHMFAKDMNYGNLNEPYRRCWTKDMNNYYKHYENIDVLLVPLKENDFNLVKSQLKVIEAGFGHKAIIANNVGPYTIDLKSMIEKGGKINEEGNALLIDSSKNHKLWAKYITRLVEDRDMLEKLKNNLHNTVKDTYSLETVCKDRVDLYLKMMNYK